MTSHKLLAVESESPITHIKNTTPAPHVNTIYDDPPEVKKEAMLLLNFGNDVGFMWLHLDGIKGQTTHSTVFSGSLFSSSHPEKLALAVKSGRTDSENTRCLNESDLLSELRHPNIIRLFSSVGIFDHQKKLQNTLLLMEPANHDVATYHKELTPERLHTLIRHVSQALQYIHEKNIVHRDVKPKNILVVEKDTPTFKLGDFGLAEHLTKDEVISTIGTVGFKAPDKRATPQSDMWSFAATVFNLISSDVPKPRNYAPTPTSDQFKSSLISTPESQLAVDLVLKGLALPEQRLSAENILDQLKSK